MKHLKLISLSGILIAFTIFSASVRADEDSYASYENYSSILIKMQWNISSSSDIFSPALYGGGFFYNSPVFNFGGYAGYLYNNSVYGSFGTASGLGAEIKAGINLLKYFNSQADYCVIDANYEHSDFFSKTTTTIWHLEQGKSLFTICPYAGADYNNWTEYFPEQIQINAMENILFFEIELKNKFFYKDYPAVSFREAYMNLCDFRFIARLFYDISNGASYTNRNIPGMMFTLNDAMLSFSYAYYFNGLSRIFLGVDFPIDIFTPEPNY